ncbi:caprin homolog isoform X2 [Sitodiplosis mosellana]|uniref:caprin homolog isoform X2 n=1 Tax=Sitodiplosis mosellana TaxID=263140 RepID=UPI002443B6E8|nr:caprin homolog isoform X2 [Sitodiplosis mosellana]
MPSAASVKVDKPPTTNILANNAVAANKEAAAQSENVDNSSPVRQISLIIEHKIRNLEKRKSKLESYRDLEKTGKDLSADKKIAILKYDEVAMTLEFAREFSKQIDKVIISSEKDLKKKQKKDESLKKQNETSKIREVLIIQDILNVLKDESVRNEFLAGTNGACKLEESDFELLDSFATKILPKRSTEPGGISYKNSCQKAADLLSLTIDGKQKEFEASTTYANVKAILKNIQKSAYFEKLNQPQQPPENNTELQDENSSEQSGDVKTDVDEVNAATTPEEVIVNVTTNVNIDAATVNTQGESGTVDFQEAPCASAVPVPTFTPQQPHTVSPPGINAHSAPPNLKTLPQVPVAAGGGSIPLSQVPPSHQIHTGHVQPTTVRAVESAYFKQHQYIQQMARPLAEVLGTGNFFFLQDSELDSPEVPNNMTPHQNTERPPVHHQIGQPPQQPTLDSLPQSNINPTTQLPLQRPEVPTTQHQMHTQPSQAHQNQQVNATYWKSPGVSGIDTKSVGASVVEAKTTGVAATFNNQSFPLIHNPQSSFANVVPPTPQQVHIPGFATPNAPIPIPAQLPTLQQSVPQQTTSPNANQMLVQQSQPFVTASKFVNQTTLSTHQNITENNTHDLHANTADIKENEWKSDDIPHVTSKLNNTSLDHSHKTDLKATISNGNNAWRDSYTTGTNKNSQESNEWNGVPNENGQDDSNTWAGGNSNQRYQYRQGPGNYRSSASKSSFSKNATSNYRGRSNGSYNNGNNSGNGVGNSRGSTNGNGSSSSFYRNNDNNTFYQNGSRTDKSSDNNKSGGGAGGGGSDVKNFSANRYRGNPQRNSNNANIQSSNNKKNFNFVR